MNDDIGKKAENKIREWLDKPEEGYSFDRFYDQMTGFYLTSRNICDFVCYKYPNIYYIESKATYSDRFDFKMIQPHQKEGLLLKSSIKGCYGFVIVLFATYKRAFILDIQDIQHSIDSGKKSINIQSIDKWKIPYAEIQTVPNNRKQFLDYNGDIEYYKDMIVKLKKTI